MATIDYTFDPTKETATQYFSRTQSAISANNPTEAPLNTDLTKVSNYSPSMFPASTAGGTKTLSGGAGITAPTTSPITSTSLAPTPTTAFQTQQPTNPYPVSTLPDFSVTAAQQPASDLTKSIQDLNNQLVGKTAYQSQQESIYGVDVAQKSITDLGSQLTQLKNEAAAIPLQLQQGAADRGVTTPLLGAQENSRLRTNAIAALGVSSLLSAAQGQLANAQSLANKAVEQKYGPIEERITVAMSNLELIMNSPEYTNDERKQAFQMNQYLQAQSDAVAQQKTDYANVLKISTEAASNINNFQATAQYPTAAVALQAMGQATSPQEALQIAASVGLMSSPTSSSSGPASIQEYEYAKSQGFTGTYQQWEDRTSQYKPTTTTSTGGKEYDKAAQFITDNKGASYAELFNSILQYTNLTSTEANALLAKNGITKPATDDFASELDRLFGETEPTGIDWSLYKDVTK